jgi:hypothetical protein
VPPPVAVKVILVVVHVNTPEFETLILAEGTVIF